MHMMYVSRGHVSAYNVKTASVLRNERLIVCCHKSFDTKIRVDHLKNAKN